MAPIRGGPRAPLHAVDRAQIAVFIGPLVPNAHVIILQEFHIGITAQEPQQLADDPAEVDLLRGQQREGFRQVIAQLCAENGARAGAGAIAFGRAFFEDAAEEILIRGFDRGTRGGGRITHGAPV